MPSLLSLIIVFLDKYLVPFLFVVGLFFFVYAVIEYVIVGGGGDEGRAEHGRELFLKSIGWFFLGILAHLLVLLLSFLSTISFQSFEAPIYTPSGDVNIERSDAVLEVPDVPRR